MKKIKFTFFDEPKEQRLIERVANELMQSVIKSRNSSFLTEWEKNHNTSREQVNKEIDELKLKKEELLKVIENLDKGNITIEIKISK